MADFKYIMQGVQKDINFFDEIKEVLETEDYTSIAGVFKGKTEANNR